MAATDLVATPAKPPLSPRQTKKALVIPQTLRFRPETLPVSVVSFIFLLAATKCLKGNLKEEGPIRT